MEFLNVFTGYAQHCTVSHLLTTASSVPGQLLKPLMFNYTQLQLTPIPFTKAAISTGRLAHESKSLNNFCTSTLHIALRTSFLIQTKNPWHLWSICSMIIAVVIMFGAKNDAESSFTFGFVVWKDVSKNNRITGHDHWNSFTVLSLLSLNIHLLTEINTQLFDTQYFAIVYAYSCNFYIDFCSHTLI